MICFALIGCGRYTEAHIIPALLAAEGAELRAVVSRDPDRARQVAESHGVPRAYGSAQEALEDEEIGALFVSMPVLDHCPLTVDAASAGRHVLCEKPMAMNVFEANRMIEGAAQAGVKLMVAHNLRFHAVHRRAKELLESGEIGQVIRARARFSTWFPQDPKAWRQHKEQAGGGPMMDLGIHMVDLFRFLVGEVKEVACFHDNLVFPYWGVEDSATILLRFANGAHGIVTCDFNLQHPWNDGFSIQGTEGEIEVRGTAGASYTGQLWLKKEDKSTQFHVPACNHYQAEIEHFVRWIEQDEPPISPGESGRESLRVIMAAYRSAATRKVVQM